MTDELTCPKCRGQMRRYERNGIHIDQCTECRGVFLDRGELEHLITAEAAYSQSQPRGQAPPAPAPAYGYEQRRPSDHGYGYGGHRGKRRKSFLEEFFD